MEYLSIILSSILCLLPIILLPLHIKKRCNQRITNANKLPPGPWKLPIIGSIHHLLGELPHHRLSRIAKTYGHIFHLKLGEIDVIVITSPELACVVMKTQDIKFASRPPLLAGKLIFYNYSDIVFSPYGNYWWQLRKICSMRILSNKRVKPFSFIREEEGDNLCKKIRMSAGSPVNLTNMFLSAANSTVARAVFGKECCVYQERFFTCMREIMSLTSGFNLVDMFPSRSFLGVISGLRSQMERAHRNVDAILTQIIKEHQAKDNTGNEMDDDLIDSLLRIKRHGELDVHLTLDNVKAVILNLFIGGTDTTSNTLTWAMLELIRHPKVMKKAQLEVRKCFNEKTKKDDMDASKLHYLNCIIKETLRLHPVTPLLVPRICYETVNLSGYTIPAKSRVVINAWAIMRDPMFWENPESFEPDRFEDNTLSFKEAANFQYIPFGAGRRICPGISFAVASIEQWLAQLLFNFNWDLPENSKLNSSDFEEVFGASVVKKNALHLVATPLV